MIVIENQLSYEYFCRNLFILRKYHRLTQKEMARLLGISVGSLRKIESGVLPPRLTVDVLDKIYVNFGILPSRILYQDLFPK